MAIVSETTLRDGLAKLGVRQNDIDELIQPTPVPFPPPALNGTIDYPDMIQWLADFDTQSAKHLMHETGGIPYRLLDALKRYRRMKNSYEKRVLSDLKRVMTRSTGRAVLGEIQAAGKLTVSISPYPAADDDDYNADARPLNRTAATHAGMPNLDNNGRPSGGSGSGSGSDVIVEFSPEIWGVFSDSPTHGASRCTSCTQPTGPAAQSDEILCHELVHAGRMMRGLSYRLGVNRDYGNEEEFLAVVITNVYLAEKGQTHLRRSHSDHSDLDHPEKFLNNSQNVNLSPRMLLERFRLIQGSLFRSLADIKAAQAWFNPVRDYNDELKQGVAPPA